VSKDDLIFVLAVWLGLDHQLVRVTDVPGAGHIYVVVDAPVPSWAVHEVIRRWAPLGLLWIVVTDFYEPPVLAPARCDCCDRGDEYNGFASGPLLFVCPKDCGCHD
jgi:hypothetical protein